MAGRLTDGDIAKIAITLELDDLKTAAIAHLGITNADIKAIGATDPQAIIRGILNKWRMKNDVPNQKQVLLKKLSESGLADMYEVRQALGIQDDAISDSSVQPQQQTHRDPGATSSAAGGSDKELTTRMILKLSERLTSKEKLRNLALDGLDMKPYVFEKHINNNLQQSTEAAYNLLMEWMNSQRDRKKAYAKMQTAIDTVQLRLLLGDALD